MRVYSAEEMRELDRRTVEEAGVPSLILMENAGRAVATAALVCILSADGEDRQTAGDMRRLAPLAAGPPEFSDVWDARVIVVAGTGNNGGDGLVAARHLLDQGIECGIVLAGPVEEITGDARVNLEALIRREANFYEYREEALDAIEYADVIVDALYGTGLRGEMPKEARGFVRAINSSDAQVVAVDIPSGVNADTGKTCEDAVYADVTVTFAALKPGLLMYPGASFAGEVVVADIGIPPALVNMNAERARCIITADEVAAIIGNRMPDSHKGSHGHAGLFAGSTGMVGAAAMSGEAAALAGAGLTTVVTPGGQYPILAARTSAECMTLPIGAGDAFCAEDVDAAIGAASRFDAVAIGCGIGRSEGTQEFVRQLAARLDRRFVLDADGLWALGRDAAKILSEAADRVVLTPHPGEMARLLGTDVVWVQSNRLEAAERAAGEFGCVCVLKGARTIVAHPWGETFFNLTGNHGLAKGGSGDVLTGIIVSFLAQGIPPLDAAVAGVWAHGRAADFAAEGRAKRTISAPDTAAALSEVFRLLGRD